MPHRIRRRIDDDRNGTSRLRAAIRDAADAGATVGALRALWDQPTSLDDVAAPGRALARRIRNHLTDSREDRP